MDQREGEEAVATQELAVRYPGPGRPYVAKCSRCGREYPSKVNGVCPSCQADAVRDREDQARAQQKQADRDRLGLQPTTRARNMVFHALESTLHWLNWARRYSPEDEGLERGAELLMAARTEMGFDPKPKMRQDDDGEDEE